VPLTDCLLATALLAIVISPRTMLSVLTIIVNQMPWLRQQRPSYEDPCVAGTFFE